MHELHHYLTQSDYRPAPGRSTPLADLAHDFWQWLFRVGGDATDWPTARIRARLAETYPIGLGPGNKVTIGNLARATKTYELVGDRIPQNYVVHFAARLVLFLQDFD